MVLKRQVDKNQISDLELPKNLALNLGRIHIKNDKANYFCIALICIRSAIAI